MKKLLFIFVLLAVAQGLFAQQAQRVFEAFQNEKNAQYTVAPGAVMTLAGKKVSDNNVAAVLKEVESARVLRLDQCKKRVRRKFLKQVSALVKSGVYEEYARTKSNGMDVLVLVKKDTEYIREIVVYTATGSLCMGVLVTGHINQEDLGAIVDAVGD